MRTIAILALLALTGCQQDTSETFTVLRTVTTTARRENGDVVSLLLPEGCRIRVVAEERPPGPQKAPPAQSDDDRGVGGRKSLAVR